VLCQNCRTLSDAKLNFCGRCGQRLRNSTPTVSAQLLKLASPTSTKKYELWRARRRLRRIAFCCLLLLLVGTVLLVVSNLHIVQVMVHAQRPTKSSPLPTPTLSPRHTPDGIVWFYDLHGQSDGVAIHIRYLPMPAAGKAYVVWLVNPHRPDQLLPVGPLMPNSSGTVAFWSEQLSSFNPQTQDLRLLYTRVIVTAEDAASFIGRDKSGTGRPQGQTVLQGLIDSSSLDGITQLFITATYTPNQTALLPGLHSQLRELGRWIANMLDALQQNNAGNVHTDLLRLLYIIEGANGPDVQGLNLLTQSAVTSAGDGFGLLSSSSNCQVTQNTCGYLELIRMVLQTLFTQSALSKGAMQTLLTTLATMEQLTRIIQQQALNLVNVSGIDTSTRHSLVRLSTLGDALLNGTDRDGDGSVDPVPGEAAAAQLYTYMQQVGAIRLVAA
jgi:hypothetical protein